MALDTIKPLHLKTCDAAPLSSLRARLTRAPYFHMQGLNLWLTARARARVIVPITRHVRFGSGTVTHSTKRA